MLPEAALKAGHAQLPACRALFVDGVLNDSQKVRYTRSRDYRQMIALFRHAADQDGRFSALVIAPTASGKRTP